MGLSRILALSIPLISFWGLNIKVNKFHSMASYSRASLVNSVWQRKGLLRNSSVGWTAAAVGPLRVRALLNTQDPEGLRVEFIGVQPISPRRVGSSGDGHMPNAQLSCLD